MTYYGPKELGAALRTVRSNTIRIAEDIPEEHYGFRATPDTRSVGETLIHILGLPRAQYQLHFVDRGNSMEGFDLLSYLEKLNAEEKAPHSKAEILSRLQTEGEQLAKAVESASDEVLGEAVKFMPGMAPASRTRFDMLQSTKEHEMHHRAQLMLMERLLGITPHLTRQNEERLTAMRTARAAG